MRIKSSKLIDYQILFCLISATAVLIIGKPIMFVSDIFVIIGFFISFNKLNSRIVRFPLFIIGLLFITDIISILFRDTGFLLQLWGIRNQYRFLIFFVVAILLGNIDSIKRITKIIKYSLFINIIVVSIQFFLLNVKGDFLGGIFGTEQGCNGTVNIYLCFISICIIMEYFHQELNLKKMAMYLILCLYWATLAELKIFYIEIILIITLVTLLTRNVEKKAKVILIGVVGIGIGVLIMPIIFPTFENFFNINYLLFYFTKIGYGNYGFNRYTALSIVDKYIFNYDILKSIWGLGIGAGEIGPINQIVSEVYSVFNNGMNIPYYGYFNSAIYVERGYMGLFLYISLFVGSIIIANKTRKKICKSVYSKYYEISIILAIISIISMIYDSSLKTASSGMIAYWVLSWPFVLKKYQCEVTM